MPLETINNNLTLTNTIYGDVSATGDFYSNGVKLGVGGGGGSTYYSDTAPSSPATGDLWFNTSTGIMYIYYDFYWVEIGGGGGGVGAGGASVTVSETAPTSPSDGDLWFDSSSGVLSIYYNDGNTSQWVVAVPGGGSGGGGVAGSGTANYIPKWSDSNTLGNSIMEINTDTLFVSGLAAFSSSSTVAPTLNTGYASSPTTVADYHFISTGFAALGISSLESSGDGDAVLVLRNAPADNSASTANQWAIHNDRGSSNNFNIRYNNDSKFNLTTAGNVAIDGTLTQNSDERIKENIELANLELCYQTVKDLPLKRFKFKDFIEAQDQHQLGFIAQEVEKAFPNSVPPDVARDITYTDASGNEVTIEKVKRLSKDQIMMAHYGCTQKLMATVEAQAETIKSLEARLAALEAK